MKEENTRYIPKKYGLLLLEGLSRVAHLDLTHNQLQKLCVKKILLYLKDFHLTLEEALSAFRSCATLSIHDPDLFNKIIQSLVDQDKLTLRDWLKVLDHLRVCGYRHEDLLRVFVEECVESNHGFSTEDNKILLRILADINIHEVNKDLQEKIQELLNAMDLSDYGKISHTSSKLL